MRSEKAGLEPYTSAAGYQGGYWLESNFVESASEYSAVEECGKGTNMLVYESARSSGGPRTPSRSDYIKTAATKTKINGANNGHEGTNGSTPETAAHISSSAALTYPSTLVTPSLTSPQLTNSCAFNSCALNASASLSTPGIMTSPAVPENYVTKASVRPARNTAPPPGFATLTPELKKSDGAPGLSVTQSCPNPIPQTPVIQNQGKNGWGEAQLQAGKNGAKQNNNGFTANCWVGKKGGFWWDKTPTMPTAATASPYLSSAQMAASAQMAVAQGALAQGAAALAAQSQGTPQPFGCTPQPFGSSVVAQPFGSPHCGPQAQHAAQQAAAQQAAQHAAQQHVAMFGGGKPATKGAQSFIPADQSAMQTAFFANKGFCASPNFMHGTAAMQQAQHNAAMQQATAAMSMTPHMMTPALQQAQHTAAIQHSMQQHGAAMQHSMNGPAMQHGLTQPMQSAGLQHQMGGFSAVAKGLESFLYNHAANRASETEYMLQGMPTAAGFQPMPTAAMGGDAGMKAHGGMGAHTGMVTSMAMGGKGDFADQYCSAYYGGGVNSMVANPMVANNGMAAGNPMMAAGNPMMAGANTGMASTNPMAAATTTPMTGQLMAPSGGSAMAMGAPYNRNSGFASTNTHGVGAFSNSGFSSWNNSFIPKEKQTDTNLWADTCDDALQVLNQRKEVSVAEVMNRYGLSGDNGMGNKSGVTGNGVMNVLTTAIKGKEWNTKGGDYHWKNWKDYYSKEFAKHPTPTEQYDLGMERSMDGGRMDPRKATPPHLLYNRAHAHDNKSLSPTARDSPKSRDANEKSSPADEDASRMSPSKDAASPKRIMTTANASFLNSTPDGAPAAENTVTAENDEGSAHVTGNIMTTVVAQRLRDADLKANCRRESYHERCMREGKEEKATVDADGQPTGIMQDTLRYCPRRLANIAGACKWARESKVTTVMIRNIPNRYTTEDVLAEIDSRGFYKAYNYFYLPVDFANKVNMGYAFLNFLPCKGSEVVERFSREFHDTKLPRYATSKILEICAAGKQGLDENVARFLRRDGNRIQNPFFLPLIFGYSSRFEWQAYPLTRENLIKITTRANEKVRLESERVIGTNNSTIENTYVSPSENTSPENNSTDQTVSSAENSLAKETVSDGSQPIGPSDVVGQGEMISDNTIESPENTLIDDQISETQSNAQSDVQSIEAAVASDVSTASHDASTVSGNASVDAGN